MKHTRVVSTKCTPGFACRAFSDTTLVCFIVNEHTTMCSYSETTWAVGIAQLTHHEVQGGGKNPSTSGLGIFAPTANRVVS